MKTTYLFHDNFKSCDENDRACNWTVLENSDLSHQHRQREKGKYLITTPGNRHLANTPPLSEFALEVTFAVDDVLAIKPELRVYFWYDAVKRAGYFVRCAWDADQCIVALCEERGTETRVIAEQRAPFASRTRLSPLNIKLQVSQEHIEVCFADCAPLQFSAPQTESPKGRVGFDRGDFFGALELRDVTITSQEEINTKVLLPETEIIFPPDINGFHTTLRYTIQVTQFQNTARLDMELSGSDLENPDVPWYPYHGLLFEILTAPYVRIGERRFYPVARENLILASPDPQKQKYFYQSLYQKPEWPLRASFYLDEVPQLKTIAVGYEYCENAAGAKHLSGGPNEVIVDAASNKILYAGAAVRKSTFILELHSQPDKEICKRIPQTDPRRDQAIAFARRNHFFVESESCRFKAVLRFEDDGYSPQEFILTCRLENAFTEEMENLEVSPFEGNDTAFGFTEFTANIPAFTQPPGVYHLYFELQFAGQNILSQRHAFEIISADPNAPTAPLLSGLPLLLSMPNEIKGLEQDQFEPYLNVENSIAHYLAITTHYPAVGRKHRIADILKIYHRQWFLWLTDRVTEHPEIDLHHDIIRQCDFLHPPRTEPVYEMWKPQTYSGAVLDVLIDFLKSDVFHSNNEKYLTLENVENIAREKVLFPEAAIEELVHHHWMPWLRFFEKWNTAKNAAAQKRLQEINPHIKRATYGPMNIYAAHGKTSHVLKYRGMLPQFNDGFFLFEDYPLACKYNIQRGPILLAAFKMAAPDVRIYPESYPPGKQGCPDGAVSYAWPPVGTGTYPAITEKKRFLEYAYAAVWFSQGEFHFWRDNGFHARAWPREYFEVMLESWKFIHRAPPRKPLRGTAYVYSDALCENHPAFYERANPRGYPWGDIYNTAEETIPYAWETARLDGQQSGFLCDLESLHQLSPEDIGLLVLPPLCGATREQLDAIRNLHERGINLLAFENVDGLEDIFGVEPAEETVAVHHIRVNIDLPDNPLREMEGLTEYTEHPLSKARYRANGAGVLLQGEAQVLLLHQTHSGKAALFNIPPTVVRRDSFYERAGYGRNSISELMNRAVAIMQRELGAPAVRTTAGKIIAFEAQNGDYHIIVMEDAFPAEPHPIAPLLTINLPDISGKKISCDKPFNVLSSEENSIRIRLQLDIAETAIITIITIKKPG
jgi:hypothetical protein